MLSRVVDVNRRLGVQKVLSHKFPGLDHDLSENERFWGPNVVRGFLWVCVADLPKMSILRIHTISSNKRQGIFKDPYHIEVY